MFLIVNYQLQYKHTNKNVTVQVFDEKVENKKGCSLWQPSSKRDFLMQDRKNEWVEERRQKTILCKNDQYKYNNFCNYYQYGGINMKKLQLHSFIF